MHKNEYQITSLLHRASKGAGPAYHPQYRPHIYWLSLPTGTTRLARVIRMDAYYAPAVVRRYLYTVTVTWKRRSLAPPHSHQLALLMPYLFTLARPR